MKKLFSIFVMLMIGLFLVQCNTSQSDLDLQNAEAAYHIGNYDKAIDLDKKVLEQDATNAAAHANLGLSYWQKGNIEDSEKHATLALGIDTKNCEALFQLAIIAEYKEQLGEAISYHEKVLDIDSNFQKTYPILSNLYASTGNKKAAIKYGKKALDNNPTSLDLLNNMGFIYLESEDYINALHYFNKVIQQDPKFAYAYNNKGYIFLKQGDYAAAIDVIGESLLLDQDNAYAYRNLAICYAQQGDKKACCEAISAAEKAKFGLRLQKELEELSLENC